VRYRIACRRQTINTSSQYNLQLLPNRLTIYFKIIERKNMNNRKQHLITLITLVTVALMGLTAFNGCKKKAAEINAPSVSAVIEQTTCPVMGGAINKNIYTEYKGKKVYFCCTECKGQFEKEPEKYLSKLPQFKK
jgi:YHS domain-containing protein